jgi:glutamine amidotransferase
MNTIAVIDYGSGNLRSVTNALRAIADSQTDVIVTSDAGTLRDASRIILPGVGAFGDCLRGLCAVPELPDILNSEVRDKGKPFLGICVGMQLLADHGEEDGIHTGLGWIPGVVKRLAPENPALKIPHMGWNTLSFHQPHALLDGLEDGCHAYFVHSYAFDLRDNSDCIASSEYGAMVPALVARGNIAGTQFHPEKSQRTGLHLLRNFLHWHP